MRVDLHIHSRYSDGLLSIEEILEKIKKNNVKVFSITDHDSIDGLEEASQKAKEYVFEFIPGLELSCDFKEKEIHLLGYSFDVKNPDLLNLLKSMKNQRLLRAEKILYKLKKENLIDKTDQKILFKETGVIGRPFFADLLIKKGFVKNRKEAFLKYLNPGQPAWVAREKPALNEGIAIIKKAGGFAVVAHPGTSRIGADLNQVLDMGLDGIEVWHPDHSALLTDYYSKYADENKLIKTGGSDWHGDKDYSFFYPIKMSSEDISLLKAKTDKS